MTVDEMIDKYHGRIKQLRADISLAMSYGGPITESSKITAQKAEIKLLSEVVHDLGKL